MEKKYNMIGLSILVKNRRESAFVLRIARQTGHSWNEFQLCGISKNNLRPRDRSIYLENHYPSGEFIYCFDYDIDHGFPLHSEGELSFFGYMEGSESNLSIEDIIWAWELKVTEASELMSMDRDALELFLTVR